MNLQQHWQDLLDKDDRTSPEEYPDMALITFDELAAIVDAEHECLMAQRDAECERANRLAAFIREKGLAAEYPD